MSEGGFRKSFAQATGHQPYDYQCRLAGGDSGIDCRSQLINIPTGLGKTAAVVLAWLWNRVVLPTLNPNRSSLTSSAWPRRLVYCLPMRTLVEQSRDNVQEWLRRLAAESAHGAHPKDNDPGWLARMKTLTVEDSV